MSMTLKPAVLTVEPQHELRGNGRLLIRGLFDGGHMFRLEPTSPNTPTNRA